MQACQETVPGLFFVGRSLELPENGLRKEPTFVYIFAYFRLCTSILRAQSINAELEIKMSFLRFELYQFLDF